MKKHNLCLILCVLKYDEIMPVAIFFYPINFLMSEDTRF